MSNVDEYFSDIDLEGIHVKITYEEYEDLVENYGDIIHTGPVVEDEDLFPLIIQGKFDNLQIWRVFATHNTGTYYDLEYDDFAEGLEKVREEFH